jgi:hypothetical protein
VDRRRGARSLLDDAIDRLRGGAFPALVLHVLPSIPFFAAALLWCVELDLRGAMPREGAFALVLLLVPKIVGWAALSAWAADRARGGAGGVAAAWRSAMMRLPEGLLAGATALLLSVCAPFTLGLSLPPAMGAFVGLAAGVGPTRSGGAAVARDAAAATTRDVGRGAAIAVLLVAAWVFLLVNLLALPYVMVQLGAGGLGLDLNLWIAAFRPDRAAAWGFAGLLGLLLVEAVAVVAAAEWQCDREAEREGARFLLFADELEERAAAREDAA